MALAFVNSTNGGLNNGGTTTALAADAQTHTAGNLLVVGIRYFKDAGQTITSIMDTASNSYFQAIEDVNAGNDSNQLWYAKNINGNASNVVTVNFSAGAAYCDVIVMQYSGADLSSPLDTTAGGGHTSAGTTTSDAFTTTQADEVIVACGQLAQLNSAWSAGSGYGDLTPSPNDVAAMQDKIVSSIQTSVTASMDNSGNGGKSITVATFKMAGAGGSTQSFTAVVGALTLAGKTDALANAFGLVKGDLTLTGYASPLSDAFKVAKGDLTLTGQTVAYSQGQQFTLVKGDLTLTGYASPLSDAFKVAKGDLTLTGQIVSMGSTLSFTVVKGDLTLAGKIISFNQVQQFTVVKGSLTLTGYGVTFSGGTNVTWSAVNPASGIWTAATPNTDIWTEAIN